MKIKKVSKTFFVPKNNYEQFGLQVYNLLVENFSKTFFVGGMVRDLLLDKKISDIDIVTTATPEKVEKLLTNNKFQINPDGKNFGVIKVVSKLGDIEITTMRSEQYSGSRYPKVKFINNLAQDSKRRDFTVNSLYFQAKLNVIENPQNGLADISKKSLKLIGSPELRLQEDPLRIIRAYRFSKELNFAIEEKTLQALENNFNLIKKLSTKKIESEINKSKNISTKKYLQQKIKKLLI
jgi:tRNA nucleotidyltransferase (CCA-adding enzyme)